MAGLEDLFGGVDPGSAGVDEWLSGLNKVHGEMAQSAQRMALETVDAWSRDDLVHVWVNAQGVVVDAEIDEDGFSEASSAQVAAAVVQAAQAAATTMRDKAQAFQAGLWQQVAELGAPGARPVTEIEEFKQMQPTVPLSPPGSRERRALAEKLAGETSDDRTDEAQPWRPSIRDRD